MTSINPIAPESKTFSQNEFMMIEAIGGIPQVPIDEQKQQIISGVKKLNRDDILSLGRILINNGEGAKIIKSSDGSLIDLNKLSDITIWQMYEQVSFLTNNLKA